MEDEFVSRSVADVALALVKGGNKQQVFQVLAGEAGLATGLDPGIVLGRLTDQEKKATSGIGKGVAIPNLRLKKLQAPLVIVATLAQKTDFNALDGAPVDIVCLLLSPERDIPAHLKSLSRLSRLFRDQDLGERLRGARTADGIFAILLEAGMPYAQVA